MSSLGRILSHLTQAVTPRPTFLPFFCVFICYFWSECVPNCNLSPSYSFLWWGNLSTSQLHKKGHQGFANQRRHCPHLRYPCRKSDILEILPSKFRLDWPDFWRKFLNLSPRSCFELNPGEGKSKNASWLCIQDWVNFFFVSSYVSLIKII